MRLRRRRSARWIAAVAAVAALTSCKEGPARFRPMQIGDAAPMYAARMLQPDSDSTAQTTTKPPTASDSINIASLHGQVVMLNVWATWCLPCLREMPMLDSLSREYSPRGLHVLGVSIDSEHADAKVNEFKSVHRISFTLLRDPDSQVTQTFQTRGVPETFLIDRNGKLAMHWIGGMDGSAAEVRAAVEKALGQ